jgi:toxin-antitoxin system PIN domain toxin
MMLWDVNILVYAFRADSPLHAVARRDLEMTMGKPGGFILNSGIVSSFLRLVTNQRIFRQPSGMDEAWDFIDAVGSHPQAAWLEADAMTMGIFKHMTLVGNCAGNKVPDAFLAALAMRHDAVLHTADRGFTAYPGLRVELLTG